MNTELILLEKNFTADEAIAHIRSEMADKESPYYAYVVDEQQVLVGVLSLRDFSCLRGPEPSWATLFRGRAW